MGASGPSDEDIVRAIPDELPVGVWVARAPGGELVYANPTFAEIMGMAALGDVARGAYAQPYGIHGRDGALYPEERMPFVRALAERATVVIDDIVIHRHDGRKVNIRAQAKPVFGDAGEITHVIIAFIDISREVRAEEARAESEARLRRVQRMESIGNLAGGVAHDFNNLLAAVKAIASTMHMREEDPRRREDLAAIDGICDSAAQLTRSLLGFAGRGRNLSAPVSVDQVVADVASIMERATDARIVVDLDLACDRVVIGDRSQLEQVVMNLAMNARDAMSGGGRLTFRTGHEGDSVVIQVADSGHGIAPEICERIFDPYFTTRTVGSHRGAGLGLATVYGIVQGHGGTIEVRQNVPRGTIMHVTLPAAAPHVRADVVPGPSSERPVSGSGCVMVVEDEEAVRRAATRALEGLGYQVIAAADGLEAIQIFQQRHAEIHAVLLDYSMPRLDGRRTFEGMRVIDPEVPVLLTTGYALNEEVQAVLELGVRGFLQKPYDARSLGEAMSRILRQAPCD